MSEQLVASEFKTVSAPMIGEGLNPDNQEWFNQECENCGGRMFATQLFVMYHKLLNLNTSRTTKYRLEGEYNDMLWTVGKRIAERNNSGSPNRIVKQLRSSIADVADEIYSRGGRITPTGVEMPTHNVEQ